MQIVLLVAAVVNQVVTGDVGDGRRAGRADRLQRGDRTAPGGEGRGEPQGARADDEDDRARAPRRPGGRDRRRASSCRATSCCSRRATACPPTAGSSSPPPSRSRRPRSPARACRSAKSTEPVPGADVAARRPDVHGVHEHVGHARTRRDDRDRHRDGHRDRPHRRPAAEHRDRARRRCRSSSTSSVEDHRGDRRHRARVRRRCSACSGASRSRRCSSPASRSPSPRSRPACRRSSRRCCRIGTREIAQPQRDREAAAGGRDAGLDLGDLLGQDRAR